MEVLWNPGMKYMMSASREPAVPGAKGDNPVPSPVEISLSRKPGRPSAATRGALPSCDLSVAESLRLCSSTESPQRGVKYPVISDYVLETCTECKYRDDQHGVIDDIVVEHDIENGV